MKFEWDSVKAAGNVRKHGVSFDEATSVFLDMLAVSGPDPDHSVDEMRYLTFGLSGLGNLLVVFHTHRQGIIIIISARRVARTERKIYEEG